MQPYHRPDRGYEVSNHMFSYGNDVGWWYDYRFYDDTDYYDDCPCCRRPDYDWEDWLTLDDRLNIEALMLAVYWRMAWPVTIADTIEDLPGRVATAIVDRECPVE